MKTVIRTKAQAMFDEIYYDHSPKLEGESNRFKQMVKSKFRDDLCTEAEVERIMAHVGGYDFVDGDHYDFSDGTECKTASVSFKAIPAYSQKANPDYDPEVEGSTKWIRKLKEGEFTNLHSCNVTNVGRWDYNEEGEKVVNSKKSGDIRLVIYNPVDDVIDYFFIPHADFTQMTTNKVKGNTCRLELKYNSATMTYSKIQQYMVASFEELAKMEATK